MINLYEHEQYQIVPLEFLTYEIDVMYLHAHDGFLSCICDSY